MQTRSYLTLATLFILVVMLSGCAKMSEREQIYSEAIVVGAGIGTGIGGGIGGVLGGTLGYIIGNEQVNQIERLDLELNSRLSFYNDQLTQQTNKFKRNIRRNGDAVSAIPSNIKNIDALLIQYTILFKDYNYFATQQTNQLKQNIKKHIENKKLVRQNIKIALHELHNLQYVIVGEREKATLMSHLNQRRLYEEQLRQLDQEISKLVSLASKSKKINDYNYKIVTGITSDSNPSFPWPPPHPSAYSKIPPTLLPSPTNKDSLKSVAKKLEIAFDQAGYSQKKYYQVPDGFALVSQLEQFNSDGTSKTPPDRWSIDFLPPKIFSLTSYLKALFTANPGRYRIIAFIVTSQPFEESKKTVTREEVMAWLDNGMVILPENIGKQPYTDKHYCTALIYEFEQPGRDKKPFLKPLSNLTGRDHLQKSNLWTALQQ
ncbi:MAG: hypothetical protein V8K32_05865 [Candidatus Electrothrix gigas]